MQYPVLRAKIQLHRIVQWTFWFIQVTYAYLISKISFNVSFKFYKYIGAKAVKLGASQNKYIFAIQLSTDCAWLSFPSTIWQLLVRVTNDKNSSSHYGLHSVDINLFNNNHPLIVKHHLLDIVAENCTSGLVYCELICQNTFWQCISQNFKQC